ncbi:MAG TPA: trypsin-like peptidase domain-containing protein, partial [Humibacillus xanthopallidus]|nr:trypsin-like peptidase domain-containing protein [Humibacillus xanthopallidus]
MTNESTTPGAGTPRDVQPDETGIIDLEHTRPVPRTEATPTGQEPAAAHDDPWFDVFGPEHPTQGPGVPARADEAWGSDRADALAEQAHRASYAPPVVPSGPSGAEGAPPQAPEGQSALAGSGGGFAWPAPTGEAVTFTDAPAGSADPLDGTSSARRKRRRSRSGLLVAGVVGLCLLSGLVGGVAGQLLDDRVNLAGSTLPEPGPGATDRPAGSIASIAATALPSVVTIKVDGGAEGAATGSGFVIDAKGHILTNNHVVEGAASGDIEVVLSNGDTEKATIVGRDASYDLAVLKVSRSGLTPLQLGPSSKVVVGDQVIAVGAPLGLDQTVTTGIVSALNRPVTPGSGG